MPELPPLNLASYRAQLALHALSARLRDARERRKLTQREAAGLAGIRVSLYRRLEDGDGTVPTRDFIKALAIIDPSHGMLAAAREA